jgi:calcineurin-like phosphoesterase family protein
MANYFFTSDQHFDHENIIKFCNRPFSSVLEMNEAIIQRYNELVMPSDIVYHLGDFCFSQHADAYFRRLHGQKFLIIGNHDRGKNIHKLPWANVYDLADVLINKRQIVLCHYAMRVWKGSSRGSWHLYGHSHNGLKEPNSLSFDVGVDSWNYYPVSLDQIQAKMEWKKSYRELFSEITEKHCEENLQINQKFVGAYGKKTDIHT